MQKGTYKQALYTGLEYRVQENRQIEIVAREKRIMLYWPLQSKLVCILTFLIEKKLCIKS